MVVVHTGETREPRRGMVYRRKHGDGQVQIIRVYPWGRGHRVQWHYVGYPDERREESLSQFRRLFTKAEA